MKLFISFAILLVLFIGIDALDKKRDCKCRIQSRLQKRIINGKLASRSAYPWYATIEFQIFEKIALLSCSASILNEDTILLAGHCLPPHRNLTLPKEFMDKYKVVIKGSDERIAIKHFYIHPKVNLTPDFRTVNDIGIIKLNKTIKFNRYIQPACLNLEKIDKYPGPLNVAGFGHQQISYLFRSINGDVPLHYDPATRFKFSEAKVYDRTEQLCPEEKDQKICVHSDNKQGTCIGDQGSGLHMTKNGKTYIVGINTIPFRKDLTKKKEELLEFCNQGSPATRLSAYKDFIDKYAGDYCI